MTDAGAFVGLIATGVGLAELSRSVTGDLSGSLLGAAATLMALVLPAAAILWQYLTPRVGSAGDAMLKAAENHNLAAERVGIESDFNSLDRSLRWLVRGFVLTGFGFLLSVTAAFHPVWVISHGRGLTLQNLVEGFAGATLAWSTLCYMPLIRRLLGVADFRAFRKNFLAASNEEIEELLAAENVTTGVDKDREQTG